MVIGGRQGIPYCRHKFQTKEEKNTRFKINLLKFSLVKRSRLKWMILCKKSDDLVHSFRIFVTNTALPVPSIKLPKFTFAEVLGQTF